MTTALFDIFRQGASVLCTPAMEYAEIHAQHGLTAEEWRIATSKDLWSPNERRQVRSVLGEIIQISVTIAGLPPVPLPGQYIAAVICSVVSPCNRMVAAVRAPESYDAVDASGLSGSVEIEPMAVEQMISLVLAYSGGLRGYEPSPVLPVEIGSKIDAA